MADRYASLNLARSRLGERIKRLNDLRPVMVPVAAAVERAAQSAIDGSRSPQGEAFAPLAASTMRARKPGEGSRPLDKTGRSRAQIKCFASQRNGFVLTIPRNLNFHMTANGRRHKRNAFVFEKVGGKLRPSKKVDQMLRRALYAYVAELKQPQDIPLAAE